MATRRELLHLSVNGSKAITGCGCMGLNVEQVSRHGGTLFFFFNALPLYSLLAHLEMEPFTIIATVIKITAASVSAAHSLNELRNKYNDAPMIIVAICSETTLIGASLSQIQNLVLRRRDLTNVLNARPDLATALDTSLVGCAVLFSCLHEEMQRITKGSKRPSQFTWKGKTRAIWNHDRLKELLDGLRGQQTAINTIISLLQVDSLEEIKQLLQQNNNVFIATAERTRSLRESTPTINVPNSIYCGDEKELSICSTAISLAAPSETEFDFDDQIVNSRVYRKILAQAMTKITTADSKVVEGDLADFTDTATIKETAIQEGTILSSAVGLLKGTKTSRRIQFLRRLAMFGQEQNINTSKVSHDRQHEQNVNNTSNEFDDRQQERNVNDSSEVFRDRQQSVPETMELRKWTKELNEKEKALGPEHPDTLTIVSNLGFLLVRQSKYEEAEVMYRRALEAREKVLGPRHPETLNSVNRLGLVLSSQGKYGEAEATLRRGLREEERVLGPDHPETLTCVNDLGVTLESRGRYEEAEVMYRRALRAREKVLGPEHPSTLSTVRNLRSFLEESGRCEEAEAMRR